MRILVVEDETRLADVIASRLKKDKYIVDVASDGNQGLEEALNDIYDLIILDIMLPGVNGMEILKAIKENGIQSKVIMLTAKSQLEDKLSGFAGGADDYVTKPFHLEELAARVNVQLRRSQGLAAPAGLEAGDLRLMIHESRLVNTVTMEAIDVAGKEFQLLEYFLQNPGQVLSREQIYSRIWGIDSEFESNNLEAYLSFIRKKLKAIGSKVKIKAVRGLGYRLESGDEKA